MLRYLFTSVATYLLLNAPLAAAQEAQSLQSLAESIVQEDRLVGLAISTYQIHQDGSVDVQKGVAGLRKANEETPIGLNDQWHIGSCTKAMTALLLVDVLSERGLSLNTPVPEVFKSKLESIDPAWDDVTLEALLTHRSGIKDLGAGWMVKRIFDERPIQEQRLETAQLLLSKPPELQKDEFKYSNFGYILAGAAIEVLTGEDWEDAVRTGLPGKIMGEEGWGFGPPQGAQPEGHRKAFLRNKLKPVGQTLDGADNPRALGPAGTVHATHDSWAKFGLAFLDNTESLSDETKARLLTAPEGADYAAGWGVSDSEENGTIYSHAGSNTMWLSQIVIVPERQAIVLVSTNTPPKFSNESVRRATREAIASLKD